ncbi:poly-gamma-glutamate hydrolase family protein [Streptomyces sp. AV19]|uniref:poly-gamma-glutamate hydrolase family protein n=1 Tax=Streptomyces sp. AV19 TaxID=2793068 RepID=UPI0018FE583E|nr:poly-gamma-glutamate hydrolase family protein [Streptomyces sp. AV19]MBH1937091.1 poly-gamma-glutamate hydrolase family protein [Streptomyces sp. AV19]MDG4533117.1 poly-gamma-glutamate hydrolase family protein [Streptomyces sp. AV19]
MSESFQSSPSSSQQPRASRRTLLTALAAATVGAPLLSALGAGTARASAVGDTYASNTELYQRLPNGEGTDYARRYRRHEMADASPDRRFPFHRTTVLALHGGGIEAGTSELCLGIAGYHPATLERAQADGPVYDYWMFEGLRNADNRELHVTSKHCDDRVALAMAAGSLNVLSLHGCTASQAGVPASRPEAVVVGGRNTDFQRHLHEELRAAGFQTVDGSKLPDLNGDHADNPCNRTLLGKGGQLEITTELRQSMFGTFTRQGRAKTTNDTFRSFTAACRAAIGRLEAGPDQVIL